MLKLSNLSTQYSEIAFVAMDQTVNGKILEILSSEQSLAIGTTLLVHHIALSCVSIVLHREGTHKSIKLDSGIRKVGESIIKAVTTIDPKEWIAAHTHHHRVSDILWNKDSEKLGDPHSPRKYGDPSLKNLILQLTNTDKLIELYKEKIKGEKQEAGGYFDAINIIRETTRRENGQTHKPVHPLINPIKFIKTGAKTGWEEVEHLPETNVRLAGRKPFMLERLIPGLGLVGIYTVSFGPKIAAIMIVGHAVLGNMPITLVNGLGHSANTEREGATDYSQNITSDGKIFLGRRWNNILSFIAGGEEHHGNHHDNMRSADITLGDPNQFDIGYWYIKQLEKLGLAKNIKASKQKVVQ